MIIRDSSYTPPGCPSVASEALGCTGVDNFYQVSYRVYLRYTVADTTPDSLLTFNLDHARLNARIRLVSSGGFSFIDHYASGTCFKEGAGTNWDLENKVLWDDKTANEIAVDFMNETTSPALDCGASDALISFSPTMSGSDTPILNAEPCPSGKKCTYAYLFPVIVQAYPGEIIQLECIGLDYDSYDQTVSCSPSPCAVNTNNAGFNGIFPDTVKLAATPAGDNANLLVRLTTAVSSSTITGAEELDVEIVNTDIDDVTVDYLEFMVKIDIDVNIPALQFGANAPISIEKVHTGGTTYDYFLHYSIPFLSGLTLEEDDPVKLSTIIIGPPMPFNQNWEGLVSLIAEDKSRVRSETECSRLVLSDTTCALNGATGDDPCDDKLPEDVFFTIKGQSDSTGGCTPPKILMGFYTTQTSTIQLVYDYFECEVEFDWSGDLSISGVNFINGWDCSTNTGCYTDCYEVDGSNSKLLKIKICDEDGIVLESANNYEAFFEVEFEGVGCINGADLQILRYIREYPEDPCVPLFDGVQDLPVCGNKINGHILTEADNPIEDVFVYMAQYENDGTCNNTSCPPDTMLTNSAGEFQFCTCEACNDYIVTPYKNNDPLNGVSTFDLVLINKHILGTELLNSPYKFIAADANKSNSITTLDIIEFRKLILGNYTNLPNNTSWRFVQTGYEFPSPNPLSALFPETDSVPPSIINFIGIKIGDVNGNAVTNSRPEDRPVTTLAWPASVSRGSKTLTVPVYYTGTEPLEAIQLGLRFDPVVLQLISPSQGDLPGTTVGNFGLDKAPEGEIRMLWLPDGSEPDQYILPGAVLFYLSFEVTGPIPESGLPLWLDHTILESLAWRPDALEYQLQGDPLPAEFREAADNLLPRLRASCRPNPTTSEAVFHIIASEAGPGRIALFDAFGKLVFMRKVSLHAGEQDIPAPEVAQAPPGVYVWKVYAGGEKISGHLIRQ